MSRKLITHYGTVYSYNGYHDCVRALGAARLYKIPGEDIFVLTNNGKYVTFRQSTIPILIDILGRPNSKATRFQYIFYKIFGKRIMFY